MPPSYEALLEKLTAPGAPFEIAVEEMNGRPLKNFVRREKSLREKIARAAERGDLECMVQGDRRISFREFGRLVWGAARALRDDFGFERGDRLAVLAYNSPDWIISLFGATSLGGIGVGLNGWWASEEIDYALRDSGSRFLVVDERLYSRVAPLVDAIPSLETIFYLGSEPPRGTVALEEILQPWDEIPREPIAEDDPFVILYTSGTTGRSKGCITTHRGTIGQVIGILLSGAISLALRDRAGSTTSQNANLLTSPLFHVGGLHSNVCVALTTGAKLVFSQGRFDPEAVMQLIEREKVTAWGAIPTMLHRVVHHPKVETYDLSSLRTVSFGGAPTAPETIERARAVLPIEPSFGNIYGLTETHGAATTNVGKDLLARKTSAGRPLPILDLKIVDEAGREQADGQLGEILFRGATVTPGYWNRPDATAETIRDGWLHTGDLGYRDAQGFLFVVDRAKDMILRGGENVYCVEIENLLAEHPEIDEAAIVGAPDPELGERVKAIVRRRPGAGIGVSELQRFVAAHLASFKVPEIVEFVVDPLPRNPAGKLLKNQLRGPERGA